MGGSEEAHAPLGSITSCVAGWLAVAAAPVCWGLTGAASQPVRHEAGRVMDSASSVTLGELQSVHGVRCRQR